MSTNHQVFLFLVEENGIEVLKEANGTTGQPFPDNTTVVVPGDSIEWLLGSNSHIESISSISSDEDELFSNLPTGSQNGWTADINTNAPLSPTDSTYLYTIMINPSSNNTMVLSFDPKIKVIAPHDN